MKKKLIIAIVLILLTTLQVGCSNEFQNELNGQIVYISMDETDSYGGLFLYDLEIRQTKGLTDDTYYDFGHDISLDGEHIVFMSTRDGEPEIYMMELDSYKIRQLTFNDFYDGDQSFSSDGNKIIFVSDRDGSYHLYSMNAVGGEQVQLTFDDFGGSNPEWSPDSGKILFSSSKNSIQRSMLGNNELFLINQDGSGLVQITEYGTNTIRPDWSPDGQYILFESDRETIRGHVLKLYLLDLETGETKRFVNLNLVGYPEIVEYPESREMVPEYGATWSPDGKWVAFTMMDDIYVTDMEGTFLMKIIENGIYPSWGN